MSTHIAVRDLLDRNEIVGPPRAGTRRFYTGKEEKLLRETYPLGGLSSCLPLLPGRSASSIYQHARILGLVAPATQKSGPREKWPNSPHIDERIRQAYENPNLASLKELARTIGRPYHWVKSRAKRIGCAEVRFKSAQWSAEEELILRQRATQDSNVIAKALRGAGYQRTASAVIVKLKRLGVSRVDPDCEDMTGRDFARYMGVDPTTVGRWIEKGWLSARQTDHAHIVTRKAAKRFIADNAAAVDLRKVDKEWFIELLLERGQ